MTAFAFSPPALVNPGLLALGDLARGIRAASAVVRQLGEAVTARELLDRAPLDELLESPQLGNHQIAVRELTRVIDEEVDPAVPFEPRDGVDGDSSVHLTHCSCCRECFSSDAGRLKR